MTTAMRRKPAAKKNGAAAPGAAASGAAASDEEAIALARAVVPKRLHGKERVIRRAVRAALAKKGEADLASLVAKQVGAKLPPDDPAEVVVEYTEESALGKRHTAVHIRGGKVTNIIKRASR
jgi:hypothetical protein